VAHKSLFPFHCSLWHLFVGDGKAIKSMWQCGNGHINMSSFGQLGLQLV
jgi:hypothetical protein